MQSQPKKCGGARPGAGRPATVHAVITVKVPVNLEQWMHICASTAPSAAAAVREIIDRDMQATRQAVDSGG